MPRTLDRFCPQTCIFALNVEQTSVIRSLRTWRKQRITMIGNCTLRNLLQAQASW